MPIRIFTDKGIAVASSVLWSAPGEPTTIVFDSSSGARQYDVYLGSNWPPLPVDIGKAGVLLESRAGDGKTIDHLADMLQAWNQSTKINGRALVGGVYEGGNRFGLESPLLEHFQGTFDVIAPEHLELDLASTDASFVLIDGKEVVEWPGHHDGRLGTEGKIQGAIDLSAGPHMLDYYNAYQHEGGALFCALAVKGEGYPQWTLLYREINFFRPFAQAVAVNYQLKDSSARSLNERTPPFAVNWTTVEQSMISPDVSDIALIMVQFAALPKTTATMTWTFDDGSTAQGQTVRHLFASPGMRTIRLSAKEGDKDLGSITQKINVHPDWAMFRHEPQLYPAHEEEMMSRDLSLLPASDLASCFAVFGIYKSEDGVLKLLPALCDKMKEVSDTDLPYVKEAALFLATDLTHVAEATQILNALIDRCTQANASPQLAIVANEVRFVLAQLILKTSNHTDQVQALIAAIDPKTLPPPDRRDFQILQADLALATGNIVDARKQYEKLSNAPSDFDARTSVRLTAKIGSARVFLDRKDFDAAQDSLTEAIENAPVEKISPAWALTQLRLYQEEGRSDFAYIWGKRLLPVFTNDGRSELLYRLTDLAFAQGDTVQAQKTLSELLQKHPYSAEAAQAKEKWPGKE
jgi:tetratricopeptide (TPR) repeat protein